MKRKTLVPVLTLASVLGVGVLANMRSPSVVDTFAASSVNTAENWVVTNGAPDVVNATDVENGVQIGGLHAYSAEMSTKSKVTLDGLTFTYTAVGQHTATAFYFSQNGSAFAYGTPTVSMWSSLYGSQTRINVGANHDYNAAPVVQTTPKLDGDYGFGVASSGVMNGIPGGAGDGFKVKFERVSVSWYSITFTELSAGKMWESNANYAKNEAGLGSTTVYMQASVASLDEDGAAYMHVVGLDNAVTHTVAITDFVDGTKREIPEDDATEEERAHALTSIASLNEEEYPLLLQETIKGLKDAALLAATEAQKPSQLDAIVKGLREDVKALYREYAGFEDLTENDPTSGVFGCWGTANTSFAKRFDDKGGVMLSFVGGYGERSAFERQYDMLNIDITINFSELPDGAIGFVNFSSYQTDYFNNFDKFFNLEFLKINATDYIAVLSNTDAHNACIDDFYKETYTQFDGRRYTTGSGTFDISISTAGGVTKFNINGDEVEVETNKLTKDANVDTLKSYVQTGLFNTSERINYLIEKIEDEDSKEYHDSIPTLLETAGTDITAVVEEVASFLENKDLTDEVVAEYTALVEARLPEIVNNHGLDNKDYIYYGVQETVETCKALLEAPIHAYQEAIVDLKNQCVETLDALDPKIYREEEQALLATIVEETKGAIEAATTFADIKEVLEDALEQIGELKTNADYELDEAKVAAKDEITKYKNLEDYRDEQMAEVQAVIVEVKAAIDAAETVEAVADAVKAGKAKLDTIKTDAQLIEEEKAAALAAAKEAAKAELASYKADSKDYDKAGLDAIAAAKEAANKEIDEATSVEAVNTILAGAKSVIDAVPVKKGCGGSIVAGSVLVSLLALAGIGLTIVRRKKD